MKTLKKFMLIFLLTFVLSPLFSKDVQASDATLEFKHVEVLDQTITTKVYLSTGGNTISSVTADFTYPSDLLEVTDIDISDSIFDIAVKQDYSLEGTVYLQMSSTDGVSKDGTVAVINFKTLTEGEAQLVFSDNADVLSAANSENILGSAETGYYSISQDLTALPETGAAVQLRIFYALFLIIAFMMLIIFALAGFTMWGGIYFSLGKWEIKGEYDVGVGKGKGKKKELRLQGKKSKDKNPKKEE
jgi:hypothetical protein